MSIWSQRPKGLRANLLLSLVGWLLLLTVSPAVAQTDGAALLGPDTFVRGKGKPTTATRSFDLAGFRPPFTLHLQNGGENGSNRVSNARVWLNGQLLFGPSAFSQRISDYDVPIDLTERSTLQVWIASKPGSELTLWIEGVRNTPPVADAGPDRASNVLVGDVVALDGSASSDPDGNALTYSWSLIVVPAGSAATLSDATAVDPNFMADEPGTYTARLTVNDGLIDSPVDDVSITVVVPPPTVSITSPEDGSVVAASPVTVTGTVDDPLATITVNGNATTNNNGSYSADVALAEGENTVTVIATNSTGEGNASVDVILRTVRGPGPAMKITTPKPDFTAGIVWDGTGAAPLDSIPVAVNGSITTPNGSPTVTVNGVAATIGVLPRNPLLNLFCSLFPNAPACDQRYSFSADIQLSKGRRTITAVGQDAVGSTTVSVSGVADYCLRGAAEPGVLAERGNGQNNRCHEIDGCGRNKFGAVGSTDTVSLRNQPMPNAIDNLVTVEFGSGYIPPSDLRNDFFVHGQRPARPLGCNIHDTCYQTCVPPGGGDRIAAFGACNLQQYENHKAMCRKAYPATCPFTGLEVLRCPNWLLEKTDCFTIATIYLTGVEAGGGFAYNGRQDDYCSVP